MKKRHSILALASVLTVSPSLSTEVQVSGLQDYNWGTVESSTNLPSIDKSVCVYLNQGGTYTISLRTTSGGLLNTDGPSDIRADYTATFFGAFGSAAALIFNTVDGISAQKPDFAGSEQVNCTDGLTGTLRIDPGIVSHSSTGDGFFTDTLIIEVSPD